MQELAPTAEALKMIAGDHQTQTFTKCFGCNDTNGPVNPQCIHCGERVVSIDSADNFACSYCNTSCTREGHCLRLVTTTVVAVGIVQPGAEA
jgi:hypothetical protein